MIADPITWQTTHGDTVEVYYSPRFQDLYVEDGGGPGMGSFVEISVDRWRFRVRAANNKIVEQGSEGYTRKSAAIRAAERHHPRVVHVKDPALPDDGACQVCDECDGDESHGGLHDCGHDR